MSKLITTEDGSSTLFLDEYDQAMHSTSGAYGESLLKHVIPSRILEKKHAELHVLDVGFGLGYNVLALAAEFRRHGHEGLLNIVSLEKEKSFAEFMNSVTFNDERDEIYSLVKKSYIEGHAGKGNIQIKILFGDARETITKLDKDRFDAVFQDPFSPAKNPELWSVDYFRLLSEKMRGDCILTTYSSADHVRAAMLEAGLFIGAGPAVGKKREGTIAAKSGIIETLSEERISEINNNPRSEPYRDKGLCLKRDEILANRLELIRRKKLK